MDKRRYITGLDGLRTIGVLFIILYHIAPKVFPGGYLGVIVFFVLTGYLITSSLLREKEETGRVNFRSFFWRRAKRLYPSLVTVFLGSAAYLFLFQSDLLRGIREQFFFSLLSVQNWWQLASGISYFDNFTSGAAFKHIYFLSIEGQFYILIALMMLVLWALTKSKKTQILTFLMLSLVSVLIMALVFSPVNPNRAYYGTDARIFSLLIGSALALAWPSHRLAQQIDDGVKRAAHLIALFSGLALLGFLIFLPDQSAFAYRGGMAIFSLLAAIFIASIIHPALIINRILTNSFFTYIGSRAYGIYLWQLPVFVFAQVKVLHADAWYNLIWQIALVLVLAELTHRFIEVPLQVRKGTRDRKSMQRRIRPFLVTLTALLAFLVILTAPASSQSQKNFQAELVKKQEKLTAQKKVQASVASSSSKSSSASSEANQESYSPEILQVAQTYGLEPKVAQKASGITFVGIGDSVMIDGSADLQAIFPHSYIDAVVGRHTAEGAAAIQAVPTDVKKNVSAYLIGLGTNGSITAEDIASIMAAAGSTPVYWINVQLHGLRSWEGPDNQALNDAIKSKKYSNLRLIDWKGFSDPHPDWFVEDQFHQNTTGALNYTQLIATTLVSHSK